MALWEWCNTRFGALGGGVSIDRHLRTEGYSWWATEGITDVEVDALVERPVLMVLRCCSLMTRPCCHRVSSRSVMTRYRRRVLGRSNRLPALLKQ